jgi:putative FmdB family regulatory protein
MPTYVYRCEHCGEEFERIETISEHEASKPKCPKCASETVVRLPSVHRDDIQEELSASCVRCAADFTSASLADGVDSLRAQMALRKQGRPAWISFSC